MDGGVQVLVLLTKRLQARTQRLLDRIGRVFVVYRRRIVVHRRGSVGTFSTPATRRSLANGTAG